MVLFFYAGLLLGKQNRNLLPFYVNIPLVDDLGGCLYIANLFHTFPILTSLIQQLITIHFIKTPE